MVIKFTPISREYSCPECAVVAQESINIQAEYACSGLHSALFHEVTGSHLQPAIQAISTVVQAYLEGSEDVLKEYCSDAMLERLLGIYRATKAEGQITDSTILEYSDVDMVDMKMLDNDPVIILHFSCQQINCVRDQYGNVVSGAPDDVNRVYYYWAVQQDGVGSVSTTGEYIPPRWKLTEMLLRGMHQLL